MVVLPPGTLLQLMYLDTRLEKIPAGRFIEIGPGSGEITNRLLKAGWVGTVYDLSTDTIEAIKRRFESEIATGRLTAMVGDYLSSPILPDGRVDLIISCMVMEHLDTDAERRFMLHSAQWLKAGGRMIGLVPASPEHWGIEDDIAGHCRRYTKEALQMLTQTTGWQLDHVAGLTYPVSNMLLPLSNYLVKRQETNRLSLPLLERTKHSGHRNVRFKTHFPAVLKLMLNEWSMQPLYWLQRIFMNSNNSLVLYFETSVRD